MEHIQPDKEINDGGPAFPYSALTPEGPQIYGDSKGMSLRDYFAVHANDEDIKSYYEPKEISCNSYARAVARYRFADAMLKAREK